MVFSQLVETCPVVEKIKSNKLNGYVIYHIDNGMIVSQDEVESFQREVKWFELAEWLAGAPEGEAHCYYSHHKNDSSYLGVFLAKPAISIDANMLVWEYEGSQSFRCQYGVSECKFITNLNIKTRWRNK